MQLAGAVQRDQRVDELDSAPRSRALVERGVAMSSRVRFGPAGSRDGRTQSMNDTPSTSSIVKYQSPSVGVQLVQRDEVRMRDVGERAELALEANEIAARRPGAEQL